MPEKTRERPAYVLEAPADAAECPYCGYTQGGKIGVLAIARAVFAGVGEG